MIHQSINNTSSPCIQTILCMRGQSMTCLTSWVKLVAYFASFWYLGILSCSWLLARTSLNLCSHLLSSLKVLVKCKQQAPRLEKVTPKTQMEIVPSKQRTLSMSEELSIDCTATLSRKGGDQRETECSSRSGSSAFHKALMLWLSSGIRSYWFQ